MKTVFHGDWLYSIFSAMRSHESSLGDDSRPQRWWVNFIAISNTRPFPFRLTDSHTPFPFPHPLPHRHSHPIKYDEHPIPFTCIGSSEVCRHFLRVTYLIYPQFYAYSASSFWRFNICIPFPLFTMQSVSAFFKRCAIFDCKFPTTPSSAHTRRFMSLYFQFHPSLPPLPLPFPWLSSLFSTGHHP